jgi:hypothetical protein
VNHDCEFVVRVHGENLGCDAEFKGQNRRQAETTTRCRALVESSDMARS